MWLSRARARQFQDGVRWFQALLLLAALFATGLHVPYHLIVCAQSGASLLSMHIFVHASRFEALDDAGHTPADGAFSPAFHDANASSPFSLLEKPSSSSSTRVTLCVTAPNALRSPRRPACATQPVRACYVPARRPQVPAGPHWALARPRRLLQARAAEWIRRARQGDPPAACGACRGAGHAHDGHGHGHANGARGEGESK